MWSWWWCVYMEGGGRGKISAGLRRTTWSGGNSGYRSKFFHHYPFFHFIAYSTHFVVLSLIFVPPSLPLSSSATSSTAFPPNLCGFYTFFSISDEDCLSVMSVQHVHPQKETEREKETKKKTEWRKHEWKRGGGGLGINKQQRTNHKTKKQNTRTFLFFSLLVFSSQLWLICLKQKHPEGNTDATAARCISTQSGTWYALFAFTLYYRRSRHWLTPSTVIDQSVSTRSNTGR